MLRSAVPTRIGIRTRRSVRSAGPAARRSGNLKDIPLRTLTGLWGSFAGPVCVASSIALSFVGPRIDSPVLPISWALLAVGILLSPKRWPSWPTALLLAVILISSLIAIPFGFANGRGPATVILAAITFPMVLYVLVGVSGKLLSLLTPLVLLHAGGIVYQGAVLGLHRAAGFAPQANVAAGALVLAMTYFLAHPRWHWLAAPLAAAIPFTGARWATGVGIAVLVGMLVTRRARPSGVAAVVAVALVVLPLHDIVIHNYTRGGVVEDAARRLPGTPSIAPRGFSEGTYKGETVGSHSVPLRMAQETGILSAVAWIVVTAYVLWRRPRLTVDWWLLAAIGALSLLYYWTWVGPLGAFWWLLAQRSARVQSSQEKRNKKRAR